MTCKQHPELAVLLYLKFMFEKPVKVGKIVIRLTQINIG